MTTSSAELLAKEIVDGIDWPMSWPKKQVAAAIVAALTRAVQPAADAEVEAVIAKVLRGGRLQPSYVGTWKDVEEAMDLLRRLAADVGRCRALHEPWRLEPPKSLFAAPAAGDVERVAALKQAAEWFQEYADSHKAKGADEKAARNQERADYCRAALKR
jgi:hypothetical protein